MHKRRPGRPPALSEAERRQRILAAAEQCFVSQGYQATHMNDVVRACGMSKKTVYRSFGTKENLFTALIDSVISEGVCLDVTLGDRPADVILTEILTTLTTFVLSERQVSITRLVIAESAVAPELAAAFHENGLQRCKAWMGELLGRMQASGKLVAGQPRELATLLVGAILGDSLITALIRRPQPLTMSERDARIALLMDLVRPALMPAAPQDDRPPHP